ncbi:MAG: pyridoxal-phosphate dependent enzyme [Chloroflexi bacterium]|nr:pyridoxal-phosphate dependent enzyme [Chloroflexota bacterium]
MLPTPLQEAPRLSQAIGVHILIKRDDLTGLALGGNKTRSLEFVIGAAIAQGADILVAAATAQSNYCRQAAAAAAWLGLDAVVVLGDDPAGDRVQGNLLLDQVLGARIERVQAGGTEAIRAAAQDRVDALRREGRRPVLLTLVPEMRTLSVVAHLLTFFELHEQLKRRNIAPDAVYVSSAASTYTGLLMGAYVTGSPVAVVGIPAEGMVADRAADIADLLSRSAALLRLDFPRDLIDRMIVDDRFIGAGYGLPTPEGVAALALAARTEGLLLDPVYTAKGLAALIDHVRTGRLARGSTVIFVHTGGIPNVFTYATELAAPGAPQAQTVPSFLSASA